MLSCTSCAHVAAPLRNRSCQDHAGVFPQGMFGTQRPSKTLLLTWLVVQRFVKSEIGVLNIFEFVPLTLSTRGVFVGMRTSLRERNY